MKYNTVTDISDIKEKIIELIKNNTKCLDLSFEEKYFVLHKTDDLFPVFSKFEYPYVTSNIECRDIINKYIEKILKENKIFWNNEDYRRIESKYQDGTFLFNNIKYEIMQNLNIFSIKFDICYWLGGVSTTHDYSSYNFDIINNYELNIVNILSMKDENELLELCKTKTKELQENDKSLYSNDYFAIENIKFKDLNFYVKDDSVWLFYGSYIFFM